MSENREILPKKTKLAWGIIFTALGLFGFASIGKINSSIAVNIFICILFLIGGVLLLIRYAKERKQYLTAQQEAKERYAKEQRLADSKRQLEQLKIDAVTKKMQAEKDAVRVCPFCGAVNQSAVCDYCGSRIPDEIGR